MNTQELPNHEGDFVEAVVRLDTATGEVGPNRGGLQRGAGGTSKSALD